MVRKIHICILTCRHHAWELYYSQTDRECLHSVGLYQMQYHISIIFIDASTNNVSANFTIVRKTIYWYAQLWLSILFLSNFIDPSIANTVNTKSMVFFLFLHKYLCLKKRVVSGTSVALTLLIISWLTHWGRDEMNNISQTTFFKRIYFNENVRISIKLSLKFVPKG